MLALFLETNEHAGFALLDRYDNLVLRTVALSKVAGGIPGHHDSHSLDVCHQLQQQGVNR